MPVVSLPSVSFFFLFVDNYFLGRCENHPGVFYLKFTGARYGFPAGTIRRNNVDSTSNLGLDVYST
jgi:hypothetical protein